jgi:aspartate racemase
MGPEATVELMARVIRAVPAADDADHIPLIVDQNPQVPSRIRRLIEGTGEDPGPVLAAMGRRLEAAGAEALAMPCNTAHHYAGEIAAAVAVPFLDMVTASVAAAAATGATEVGILASPAVRKVGVFDGALAEQGLTAIWPEDAAALLATIRAVKRDGPTEAAGKALHDIAAALPSATQIVACTEFSLLTRHLPAAVTAIDTLDALVARIVAFSTGEIDG